MKKEFGRIGLLLLAAGVMKYGLGAMIEDGQHYWLIMLEILIVLVVGVGFVLKGTAEIIEETTEVLSEKTKIAAGALQSLGTAFPDMALGIVAAVISLNLVKTDYAQAINFAIIAAATTFGSNIYNIGHAFWCVLRQNQANKFNKEMAVLPSWFIGGKAIPLAKHQRKPMIKELDRAIEVLTALTVLTSLVAMSMVIFGKVDGKLTGIEGDLYQLIRPVGIVLFLATAGLMYLFRKSQRPESPDKEILAEEKIFKKMPTWTIWLALIASGVAILMAAETMVMAINTFCEMTGTPSVIAGVLAGIIGCLGEMLVVHNYTVNPKGRIGDAVVGVAMDNIVTTMGAAVVAIMGGIFLGGNALILIFVLILMLNSMLMWQISVLKNSI